MMIKGLMIEFSASIIETSLILSSSKDGRSWFDRLTMSDD